MNVQLGGTRRELASRSAIFRMIFDAAHTDIEFTITDYLLFLIGVAFMAIGLICAVLFIPVFLFGAIYGMIYPVMQLIQKSFQTAFLMSFCLTIVQIALVISLLGLAPSVWKFQSVRADIVNIQDFPAIFYSIDTIREIQARFVADIDIRAVDRFFDRKFGRDILREIKSY